jgi:hypothetical protein
MATGKHAGTNKKKKNGAAVWDRIVLAWLAAAESATSIALWVELMQRR